MTKDNISEIGIDKLERIYIKPEMKRFTLIYRTATAVHWDNGGFFLYSPKPKEWSYFDWYKHILGVVKTECNCKLILTDKTNWSNIPIELRGKIEGLHLEP